MSTTSGSRDYGRFDELAEEFAERYRRGERPSLQEYVDRLPEMAEEIREMFPAMVEVEQADGDARGEMVPPPPPLAPHLSQIGDYRILREIGRGGMGVVYEAEQISLGRRVALKILLGQVVADRKTLQRFQREAKSAARLHHTNIVPVFEVGRDRDVSFYAMQLIQGQGLEQVIDELRRLRMPGRKANTVAPAIPENPEAPATVSHARAGASASLKKRELAQMAESLLSGRIVTEGLGASVTDSPAASGLAATERLSLDRVAHPLPASESASSSSAVMPGGKHVSEVDNSGRRQPFFRSVAQIGRQAAQGLAHAHARGIVHRDVKPSNLLLDTAGVVWITDFGLAKAEDDGLTATGDILGTLRYMAPERFHGGGDGRADLFALGLTLYELLTLRPAYDSSNRLNLIEQIKNEEPARPRSIDARIPRDLETIVLKAIDKEPTRRYQTAEAMAEDLRRFLADEPILARQVSTSERYWRWARRNPVIATLGGVLTVLLVLVTIGSLLAAGNFASLAERASNSATAERGARLEADLARNTAETARSVAQVAEQKMKGFAAQAQTDRDVAQRERQRAEREKKRAEEQLTRAEWLVYAGKLTLAQNDFEFGNGGLALHYLDECQWNLRGWEHRYLWTRINAKQTLAGHARELRSAAFSPDGKRIVTGGFDQTAKVWDAETGEELLTLKGHTCWVTSAAFSPDGKRIVTGAGRWSVPGLSQLCEAKVWDAETGQEVLALRGHAAPVLGVAFSPDGRRIATGDRDGMVRVWNAETGQEVLALKSDGEVNGVAFSPDGQRIVTSGGTARVWTAETGRQVLVLKGHKGGVYGIAFSPDGQRIVTGGADNTTIVWEAATGQQLFTLKGHDHWVWSVAFSPDGQRIATGSFDQTIKVWDAATGQELRVLKGHAGYVRGVAFSPDGQRILSASDDRTAKVWDAENGQEVPTLDGNRVFADCIAFSPDGQRIVTGGGDPIARVWDASTCQTLLSLKGHRGKLWSVAFSPDGQRIVTGSYDKTAKIWDAATGHELRALNGHTAEVYSVAFSPDGKRVVTGAGLWPNREPGEAKVWDSETGHEVLALKGRTGGVNSVAFSPDGKRILTGSIDGTVRMWDSETGQEVLALKGHTLVVYGIAFSPDGRRIVTGSRDRTARVWDAEKGQQQLVLRGHTDGVRGVTFSPDGQRIVTGGDDQAVKLWDAEMGQELLALKYNGSVRGVAYSSDGQRIAACGPDSKPIAWYADKGQEVLVLKGHTDLVTSVAFSPYGQIIFAWDTQKKVLAWSAVDGQPINPVNPPPEPLSGPALSPDGLRRAVPQGNTVAVTDDRPPPKNNAWPLPDADARKRYHTERAALAEKEKQRFAAEFHRARAQGDDRENPVQVARLARIPYPASFKIAYDQKRFAEAARLAAEALKGDPKLGDDRQARHRYKAARAAAMAAAGRGHDEPPLDVAEKVKLRRQALDWMQAELTVSTQLLEFPATGQNLELWKLDADLASIREAESLAKLPAVEQQAWKKLWADVDSLLTRSSDSHKFADVHRRAHELEATDPKAAEPLFREALEGYRKTLGPDGRLTLDLTRDLASLLDRTGRGAEAEPLFRDAVEHARKQFGPDDPHTAGLMATFGSSLLQQGKWTQAESVLRECLAIREKIQPDDWSTFNTRSTLGGSLLGQKKFDEAEPLILSGYEGMKVREAKIPPPGKPRLTGAAERVVQLYEDWGKKDKAAEWRTKLAKPANEPKPQP
jgi:eukaryotic-like serine/threonine-protein kinase